MSSSTPHSGIYKQLFPHAQMMEAPLRRFVGEDWVEHIDFATLEKTNGQCVSEQLAQRSEDVEAKGAKNLPPVFPIVIYNGPPKRGASLEIANRIAAPGSLACWSPSFGTTCWMKAWYPRSNCKRYRRSPAYDSLRRAVMVLYQRVIFAKLPDGDTINKFKDFQEVEAMSATRMDGWIHE